MKPPTRSLATFLESLKVASLTFAVREQHNSCMSRMIETETKHENPARKLSDPSCSSTGTASCQALRPPTEADKHAVSRTNRQLPAGNVLVLLLVEGTSSLSFQGGLRV